MTSEEDGWETSIFLGVVAALLIAISITAVFAYQDVKERSALCQVLCDDQIMVDYESKYCVCMASDGKITYKKIK